MFKLDNSVARLGLVTLAFLVQILLLLKLLKDLQNSLALAEMPLQLKWRHGILMCVQTLRAYQRVRAQ